MPLGGVVHAQVITDLAYHNFPRVQSHADTEVYSALNPQLVGMMSEGIA